MPIVDLLQFLNDPSDIDAAALQRILGSDQDFHQFTLLRLMQLAKSCNNQTATRSIEMLLQLRTTETNTSQWSESHYVDFFKDELERRGYRIQLPAPDGAGPSD